MRGTITRRGKTSWRIKFDIDRAETGKRRFHTATVRGSRKDAETELARLLNDLHRGAHIDASKITVSDYLQRWLDGKHNLSPVTRERYSDTIAKAIVPMIGAHELQKLKPMHVKQWLSAMMAERGARTCTNIFRVLHGALAEAVRIELVSRNVADAVSPPQLKATDIEILKADQIAAVLASLRGSRLHPIASLALATGMRRGELLALRWREVDLGNATIAISRSLEQTRAGLRFKGTKTERSRTISLPPSAVDMLKAHRKEQLELRMVLGLGKPDDEALVFPNEDCTAPISPNCLSVQWGRAVPQVTFHALRHTHASALIAAGMDVVTVSRRLGHSKPTITLNVYAHLFADSDAGCADAIEELLGAK
jgi:integrase